MASRSPWCTSCAWSWGGADQGDAGGVDLGQRRAPHHAPAYKSKPWTADEARAFLHAARNERLYPAFVLGLAWDDLDRDELVMQVSWQLQRQGGKLLRTWVKTAVGDRPLPVLPIVYEAFIELAERQMYAKRAAGANWDAGWNKTGLVFTTRNGGPIERITCRGPSRGSVRMPGFGASGFTISGT